MTKSQKLCLKHLLPFKAIFRLALSPNWVMFAVCVRQISETQRSEPARKMSLQSLLRSLHLEIRVTAAARSSWGCPYAPTSNMCLCLCQEENLSIHFPKDHYTRSPDLACKLLSHIPWSGPSFPPGKITPVTLKVDKPLIWSKIQSWRSLRRQGELPPAP